jgi:hypothetical protein
MPFLLFGKKSKHSENRPLTYKWINNPAIEMEKKMAKEPSFSGHGFLFMKARLQKAVYQQFLTKKLQKFQPNFESFNPSFETP